MITSHYNGEGRVIMKTRSFKVTVIAFSIIFLFGFIFSDSGRAAEPYNLGVALSITGTGALYCKDGVDAIKLAVDEINAKGGYLGKHPLKLFIRDDQTKPDVGVRETKDLILRDKGRCVLGAYSSAVAVAIKPACKAYKVLTIAA